MAAQIVNLVGDYRIDQGSTYVFTLTITDPDTGAVYDLTGATAAGKVGSTKTSTDTQNITCAINTTTGVITCTMADTVTDDITFEDGYYDVELTETDGTVTRLVEGKVEVSLGVTT